MQVSPSSCSQSFLTGQRWGRRRQHEPVVGFVQPGEPRRQKVVTGIESTYSLGLDADTVLLRIIDDRSYEEREIGRAHV